MIIFLLLILLAILVLLYVCQKIKEKRNIVSDVTETILGGNAGKRWSINSLTLTYYNFFGIAGSMITISSNANDMRIFFSPDGQYDTAFPVDQIIPDHGSWALKSKAGKITFICHENGFCRTNKSGAWIIKKYARTETSEGMTLERTIFTAGDRKVKQVIVLAVD